MATAGIVVKDGITPSLQALAAEFPQDYRKALMDLGSRYRRRMATEFREGIPAHTALAPLSPVTIEMRRRRSAGIAGEIQKTGKTLTAKRFQKALSEAGLSGFGGKLPDLNEYDPLPNNEGVRIGWFGKIKKGLDRQMLRYQRAASRSFTKEERRKFHQMFGKTLPENTYHKPQRPVVYPFSDELAFDAYTSILKTMRARLKWAQTKAASS